MLAVKSPSQRQLGVMKNRIFKRENLDNQAQFFDLINLETTSTILDVGANIGYYSMMYSMLRPSCDIIAIEPSKANFDYLVYNCRDFANVTALNIGAHDRPTEATLCMPSVRQYEPVSQMYNNSGLMSIYGESGRNQERVSLHPLDDFLDSQSIKGRIGFIKIDVEGNEYKVLCGASGLISKYSPVFEVEINPKMLQMSGEGYLRIKGLFSDFGYKPYLFVRGDIIPYESDVVDGVLDMIFMPG